MKTLRDNWKVILAVLLLMGAVLVYVLQYLPAARAYERERSTLQNEIHALQLQIEENRQYGLLQTQLEKAAREVEESRTQMYSRFPAELKEEDQVLYMLYLEKKFDGEVEFRFAEESDRAAVFRFGEESSVMELNDGTQLREVPMTLDFATTYSGFKNMVQALATDDVITSVCYADVAYDTERDQMEGQLIVNRYVMADGRSYQAPAVKRPAVGKENIYRK